MHCVSCCRSKSCAVKSFFACGAEKLTLHMLHPYMLVTCVTRYNVLVVVCDVVFNRFSLLSRLIVLLSKISDLHHEQLHSRQSTVLMLMHFYGKLGIINYVILNLVKGAVYCFMFTFVLYIKKLIYF